MLRLTNEEPFGRVVRVASADDFLKSIHQRLGRYRTGYFCKGYLEPADFRPPRGDGRIRYVVGVGSERGTPIEVLGQGIMQGLDQYNVDIDDVVCVTSVHLKAKDPAYIAFAEVHDVPLVTCSILALKGVEESLSLSTSQVDPWYSPQEISQLSALFVSGSDRLFAPLFSFRLLPDEPDMAVSICAVK